MELLKKLIELDEYLFKIINRSLNVRALDWIMLVLSSEEFWLIAALIFIVYLIIKDYKKYRKFIILCILSLSVVDIFSYRVLKPFFARLRPCHQFDDVLLIADGCGSMYGFPSNHAGNSASILTVVIYCLQDKKRLLRYLCLLFVILVSYSRIYVGVHFLGDVLFGMFFGILISFITIYTTETITTKVRSHLKS